MTNLNHTARPGMIREWLADLLAAIMFFGAIIAIMTLMMMFSPEAINLPV